MSMVQFDVIVEHNNSLYHPKLISTNITSTFPLSHPVADIQISNEGTAHFIPDDIVRIQYKRSESWVDLFEGSINEIISTFSHKQLFSIGHTEEMSYKFITENYTGSGSGSGYIISDLITTYLSRITGDGDIEIGSTISEFDIAKNRKNVMDIVKKLESIENYKYIFSIKTDYNNGLLNTVSAKWSTVSQVPISKLTAYEKARNVISASFSENISDLYNRVLIFGNTYDDDTQQYNSIAEDTQSQNVYGIREYIIVDKSLDSQVLCEAIAESIIQRYSIPVIIGDLDLSGIDVQVGELIACKFPSLHAGGKSIDGNYRIRKVSHNISRAGWITKLNVGELRYGVDELISGLINKNRSNNLGLIK